jgi:hypothetical protein
VKTINIFLDDDDTVINIMPKFNPDNLKESIREIIDEILAEGEDNNLDGDLQPPVAICDRGKNNPEIAVCGGVLTPDENLL